MQKPDFQACEFEAVLIVVSFFSISTVRERRKMDIVKDRAPSGSAAALEGP